MEGKYKFWYGHLIVAGSLCITTVIWGAYHSYGVFFKPISIEFGWTRASTSAALSIAAVLIGVFAIVIGRLNDRFGPRLVVTACGCLLGFGYLFMSQVNAIWQLYLFWGLMIGAGMSGSILPMLSIVARWFTKRRGMMTGIVSSGIGIGTFIVPPISSWLISTFGWRNSFIILGIAVLLVCVLGAQFLKRDPSQMGQRPYGEEEIKQENASPVASGSTLKEAVRTHQFWLLFTMLFCYVFGLGSVFTHIAPHANDMGNSATIAAIIISIIGGFSIAGRVTMGSIADRIGIRKALILGFILMAASFFWLQVAQETWLLYLFAIAYGFAYGTAGALYSPLTAELFGLSSHGLILGVVLAGGQMGSAIGNVVVGHIFDITGSYKLGFLLCSMLSILALIAVSFIRPVTQVDRNHSPIFK